MQVEDDRDGGPSGLPDMRAPRAERDSPVADVRMGLAMLVSRLTGVESDLAALKTGMSVIEARLTGIENRQRHAECRRERLESRFSQFDFGVDRVYADVATLKDRVSRVELDVRDTFGASCGGSRRAGDTLAPPSHPVGCKSS